MGEWWIPGTPRCRNYLTDHSARCPSRGSCFGSRSAITLGGEASATAATPSCVQRSISSEPPALKVPPYLGAGISNGFGVLGRCRTTQTGGAAQGRSRRGSGAAGEDLARLVEETYDLVEAELLRGGRRVAPEGLPFRASALASCRK